jgi:putative transposase
LLCNAQRCERSEARCDSRAGHYERNLPTKAGEVKLRIPKLRAQTFETAIIERYRRCESSVEEALIEMYLAGVSVRRVEDITEALGYASRAPYAAASPKRKSIRNSSVTLDRRHRPHQERCARFGRDFLLNSRGQGSCLTKDVKGKRLRI